MVCQGRTFARITSKILRLRTLQQTLQQTFETLDRPTGKGDQALRRLSPGVSFDAHNRQGLPTRYNEISHNPLADESIFDAGTLSDDRYACLEQRRTDVNIS